MFYALINSFGRLFGHALQAWDRTQREESLFEQRWHVQMVDHEVSIYYYKMYELFE
ncbi:hypothetical protein GCM10025857_23160 [Alicyclobacillus contaminans]|nr:hypothetical protein GCM10025857_23160 [Alicyclobacillus contaminans]